MNARRRKQYAENPEKRRKARARARRYRRANKAKIAEQRRLDRKQNPEKMRKQHIQYTYGLSWDEYQAILARQGGVCGMCKTKSKRPLCVDHCHKTGMVRGILCSPCNLTIGLCRDSTKITRAATAYLEAAQNASGANCAARRRRKLGRPLAPRGRAPSGRRRPIRPHLGADQAASRADHPRAERADHGLVGEPVGIEICAVVAPGRGAVDQEAAAAVAPDVAEGDGVEGFSAGAGHTTFIRQKRRRSGRSKVQW